MWLRCLRWFLSCHVLQKVHILQGYEPGTSYIPLHERVTAALAEALQHLSCGAGGN